MIGYIAQMSMPDASTPSASAVLPLMTTCGTVARTAGTRYLKSRFASAHAAPASSSATLSVMTFASFLPKMKRDLFAGQVHVEAVEVAEHAQHEHVLALARVCDERAALLLHRHFVDAGSPRPAADRASATYCSTIFASSCSRPDALEQDRAARLQFAGVDASQQHLLVERDREVGFVAAIGDLLRTDADAVAAGAGDAARRRLDLGRDDLDRPDAIAHARRDRRRTTGRISARPRRNRS